MQREHTVEANGLQFHVVEIGPETGRPVLMLHGFPEYWAAWADVAERMGGEFRCILPDQRGCGSSSKPEGTENYHPKHLATDMLALLDALGVEECVLCGHDWGASVAYAMAFREPARFSHLVIANGVHPVTFQRALLRDGPQRKASRYINTLRQPGVAEHMAADDFAKTFGMFEKFSAAPWLTDAKRKAYANVWAHALPTMIEWYGGTPLRVPGPDDPHEEMEVTDEMRTRFRVRMPHLLLWGEQDTALLEEARAGLEEFCDDLTVQAYDDASHWILHERSAPVARHVSEFVS